MCVVSVCVCVGGGLARACLHSAINVHCHVIPWDMFWLCETLVNIDYYSTPM